MSLILCLFSIVVSVSGVYGRPHIVIIIADDLGWGDVGFHGMNHIPTPNIDALAASGLILQNYYVLPICTPSRAALLTAKYPIHNGMQHGVIYGQEPRGLPLSEKLLPQYLKELGYKTHLVGKWHLGHFKKEYTPLYRGFDSHLGIWAGKIDMYDHTNVEQNSWGFDFRRGFEVAHDLFGKYVTDIYTDEAIKVISSHNKSAPLFLVVSHSAVHSGNPAEFIRAPDDVIARYAHINGTQRQKFAGVLSKLDESVGRVLVSLEASGMLQESVVLFTTDNGGVPDGFNDNAGSNYPLRGTKNTLWEGGVRGAAVLWSPLLSRRPRVAAQRAHITDWLPTLLRAAGGDPSLLRGIDGVDLWEALSNDLKSERTSILLNIDDIFGDAALMVDQWKVMNGTNYKGAWDQWYGPSGREVPYDIDAVFNAPAAQAINKLDMMPTKDKFKETREAATLKCNENIAPIACEPLKAPCLFNIDEDPCERRNLAKQHPDILSRLLEELSKVNQTAVPPNNKHLDPKGDPKHWGRVYVNFADYPYQSMSHAGSCL